MKHIHALTGAAVAVVLPAWLLAVPASAQEAKVAPGASTGSTKSAPAPSAPSGGSSGTSSSGGSSGGGYSGGGNSGGGESGSGRRSGATGGSGYAAPRSPRATESGSGGSGTASNGGSGSGSNGVGTPSGERGRRTASDGSGRTNNTPGSASGGDGVPTYSRPRDGNEPVGTAVPRGTTPPRPGGGTTGIFIPGGYYGGGYGYYDPYGYGGGGGYGYYGGYYDPWYGGYPTYPQSSSTYSDEGSLRLKIKPREGEVYVDGYYVGVVDDFDGIFQRLHLDSGPHRIEVRAPGYETLDFEVRITPDHTTTYQGELKKIQ